ncbi:MAG: helix-turn-helix transcriptional regulator [Proteobacteria bacterium]|nr:helix-turn-helix transcriptional regulator [Pseudomonadota bacterium]
MTDDLIDSIYEAAAVPTLWPDVIDAISARIEGNGGFLFGVRDGYFSAIASHRHTDTVRAFMSDGWSERDLALKRATALNHPGFVNDGDLLTNDEIETDGVYRNFYRKHGIGYRAGTIIPIPSGDSLAIVLARHQDNGPVPRETVTFLDSLRPHLARAALTANRLGFERARAQADALQVLGLPTAVLRKDGSIRIANPLFQALIPAVAQDRRDRVVLTNNGADGLLSNAFTQYRAGGAIVTPASIPIPALEGYPPMIAHIVPIRGVAHDIFNEAGMLLLITAVDRAAVPTAEVLQGLFDLTPAEARVARGIAATTSVDALAASQGVTRETVRSQLRAVLTKTGLNRQSELVSLLAGAARIG